ncbi:hypothetical protein JCM9534A_33050 [Catenuloplanes indicus JCM 9534]
MRIAVIGVPGSAGGVGSCGGTFIRRRGDESEEVAIKLHHHHLSIAPILAHYRATGRVRTIDATGTAGQILAEILR